MVVPGPPSTLSGPRPRSLDQILNFGTGFIVISRQEAPVPTTAEGSTQDAVWWSRVWWSADGVTWVERTPEASEELLFGSAAAGPSGVLIRARDVNDNGYRLRSDAQLNWTRIDGGWPDDTAVFGVASSDVGWLAYGATGVGSATTAGAIWTSGGCCYLGASDDRRPGRVDQRPPLDREPAHRAR